MSFDYNIVISACLYSLFGAIVAGIFGFYIGKVLETSNNTSKKYNSKKTNKKELDNLDDTESENNN